MSIGPWMANNLASMWCTSSFDIIDSNVRPGLSAKEHDICQTGHNFCRALYVYVCMYAHCTYIVWVDGSTKSY